MQTPDPPTFPSPSWPGPSASMPARPEHAHERTTGAHVRRPHAHGRFRVTSCERFGAAHTLPARPSTSKRPPASNHEPAPPRDITRHAPSAPETIRIAIEPFAREGLDFTPCWAASVRQILSANDAWQPKLHVTESSAQSQATQPSKYCTTINDNYPNSSSRAVCLAFLAALPPHCRLGTCASCLMLSSAREKLRHSCKRQAL